MAMAMVMVLKPQLCGVQPAKTVKACPLQAGRVQNHHRHLRQQAMPLIRCQLALPSAPKDLLCNFLPHGVSFPVPAAHLQDIVCQTQQQAMSKWDDPALLDTSCFPLTKSHKQEDVLSQLPLSPTDLMVNITSNLKVIVYWLKGYIGVASAVLV